ncbi:DNA recombination/repair protein RecA, partial [candidate division WOR-3 bacterium]|nr:DNA recombination/repair protein RecA [candidate division WOR-3 bacterium]
MSKEEKGRALASALGQIEKQYGKGAIMRLGDASAVVQLDAIPTGSIGLDAVLGIGGVARGRFVEIFGPEASGKTTLALEIIAQCQ